MISIGKDELALLKERVDLVDLVRSRGRELKREGKSLKGLCPFHSEKNPSFHVYAETKSFKCFGCGKQGDAIAFLRELEGLSFQAAIEELGRRYGAGVNGHGRNGKGNGHTGSVPSSKSPASRREKPDPKTDPEASTAPTEMGEAARARLLNLVVRHHEEALARSPRAQSYLRKRGLLVPEVLKAHRVGYADGTLPRAVATKGETCDGLLALGILNEEGRETMTGMLVVPLVDATTGAVVSLYGRAVTGNRHHYLKGGHCGLFNGAFAKSSEEVVLVESVIDALSLLILGIPNVLPLYGTNGWTVEHDRLLEEGAAKRVTLLLDNDEAGRRAAEVLAAKLSRRGLGVRVAALSDHKDPNEALVAGVTADEMRQVLDAPIPLAPSATAPAPSALVEAPAVARVAARYDVEETEGGFVLTVGSRRYWARGIAGGAYERLHVNVKLADAWGTYVDRIDLYSARARRSFVVRVTRSFGLDEETVERELGYVAEAAEAWIATQAKPSADAARIETPELTDDEKKEATALLRDPRLLERTVGQMTMLGYVGEETNKALGFLVVVSRKLAEPLSAIVLSQSGAGKSGLTEILERMTPPEDVILYSRLTANALYYMPKDFLRRKVVIIEERSGSEEADYSLRTLQSRKKLILGVPVRDPRTGKTETRTIEVEGPAVFLETSTAMEVNHENATRCFELYLDETVEQTKRIHAEQRKRRMLAGQGEAAAAEESLALFWNAQRLLKPVRVDIPYADRLTFPVSWLRTRRDQVRFLSLLEASAFLHQAQRPIPKGAEPGTAVEATVEDYAIAYRLAHEVLGATLSDVKRPARELVESMKAMAIERAREKKQPPERIELTRRELRERTGLPDLRLWRLLKHLIELEWVEQVSGSKGRTCRYRLASPPEIKALAGLLTPEELGKVLVKPAS